MAEQWECMLCGKPIGMWDKVCKHCGTKQFGDNNECYPDEDAVKSTQILWNRRTKDTKKEKQPIFTEEEAFIMGVHPQDEFYRKTMELDILGKDYK